MKFGAAIPLLNEWKFIPVVVGQLLKICNRVIILRSRTTMAGQPAVLSPVPLLDPRVDIIEGDWASEHDTRNAGMEMLQDCDYVFTVDSDEIFSDNALNLLKETCLKTLPRALVGGFHTYWKTVNYRIDPPEQLAAPVIVRKDVRFKYLRIFEGGYTAINQYLFHHLSYVRTNTEIINKIHNFGHAKEVIPGWYEDIWLKWDSNKTMENLHPTHPAAYKRAVPADGSVIPILNQYGVL